MPHPAVVHVCQETSAHLHCSDITLKCQNARHSGHIQCLYLATNMCKVNGTEHDLIPMTKSQMLPLHKATSSLSIPQPRGCPPNADCRAQHSIKQYVS
jgi:hypothetical protein